MFAKEVDWVHRSLFRGRKTGLKQITMYQTFDVPNYDETNFFLLTKQWEFKLELLIRERQQNFARNCNLRYCLY